MASQGDCPWQKEKGGLTASRSQIAVLSDSTIGAIFSQLTTLLVGRYAGHGRSGLILPTACQYKPLKPNDMIPRLKAILERKKAKAETQSTTTEEQRVSIEETPALILVPAFDFKTDDEFSPYF